MTSFGLKLTAILLMLIDHTGTVLNAVPYLNAQYAGLFFLMKVAGRSSMPVFAFLVAEGCVHTGNIYRYLERMTLFAIISEIPYNLLLNFVYGNKYSLWCMGGQNVILTWALGIFTVLIYKQARLERDMANKALLWTAIIFTVISAELARVDSGGFGVMLVLVLYMFRPQRISPDKHRSGKPHYKQTIIIMVFVFLFYFYFRRNLPYAISALVSALFVWFYNGKQGRKMKWLFYVLYPAHILILVVIGHMLY